MKALLTTLALASIVGAACADTLVIQSNGTANVTTSSGVDTETISYFLDNGSMGLPDLIHGSLNMSGSLNNVADPSMGFAGIGSFAALSGDSLSFSLTGSNIQQLAAGFSINGSWTITSGTGSYAGLVGGGTFSSTVTPTSDTQAITLSQFNGNVQAAPEPVSLAVLAIGAVALLKRKVQ